MAFKGILTSTFIFSLLGACGTYVPQIQEPWETKGKLSDFSAGGELEYKIKKKIYCSIVDAVLASRSEGILPPGWAVQLSLSLQVDETGALNPGVSLIDPLPASQSFTLGLGATLSSQSTREDKFGAYWELDRLKSRTGNPCDAEGAQASGSSLLLVSELGITEWLIDGLNSRNYLPSSSGKKSDSFYKQDFLSYRIKFVVISGGSITPTWKLTKIATGNGGLPLASANRTRTHDLLLTFGPTFKAGSPNLALSSHQAQDFGIAVSNGFRNTSPYFVFP
ncbi:hypothetical protein SAMN02799622_05749 [Methylobacterium sp. UNC378MF]|uniref:hypothetical protein n=1 Tax=Methylobacterium sp. UNC378MF TaxID=1502748 RepID=UPI00087ECD49|nr:hypothetical protein [Methylobacterium sp. UNC378MF]SDA34269.1 hypothetical protein SAMN02799622_05749 [Methylobacterium sp. UNC378MF]